MSLRVVALVKQILDPELPAADFRIDASGRAPASGLGPLVMGPFERSALEVALKLRDSGAAERVDALTVGDSSSAEVLRKAYAAGADDGYLVDLGGDEVDPALVAAAAVAAVRRIGSVDLVVAGRQAGDWDHGQVGYLLAEQLGWSCVGLVRKAWAEGDEVLVRRDCPGGQEVLALSPPAVLTVTNDVSNVLRMAKVQNMMAAQRKPVTVLTSADLGLEPSGSSLEILEIRIPEREGICEMIEGEDANEVAARLVSRLRELRLL